MLLSPALARLLILGCCTVLGSSLSVRQHIEAPADDEWGCNSLAKVTRLHSRLLPLRNRTDAEQRLVSAFSCHVAQHKLRGVSGATAVDGSGATCSPVCAEALDVVVVLGTSQKSLEQADVIGSRQAAVDLLKHFELSRARGSLFGFLDVSRGAGKAVRVSPLSDDRAALIEAVEAWRPEVGGKAVTALEMHGFEQRPEVLAMLNNARPKVRQTLLILQPPGHQPAGVTEPSYLPAHPMGFLQIASDPFKYDEEIMELLVSTCPTVRIDPDLACGRMRWGRTETEGHDKITPWGGPSK